MTGDTMCQPVLKCVAHVYTCAAPRPATCTDTEAWHAEAPCVWALAMCERPEPSVEIEVTAGNVNACRDCDAPIEDDLVLCERCLDDYRLDEQP